MTSPSVLLTALAQCLCEALSDPTYGHPAPCFCGVIPGATVIQELTEGCASERNGVAWVRLALTYPSATVGAVDTSLRNCNSGLGIDIEVGVVREHHAYYETEALTEAQMLDVALWQHDDMMAARRAIVCCGALDNEDYILGMYQPFGPQGGMVGGSWSLHVGLL